MGQAGMELRRKALSATHRHWKKRKPFSVRVKTLAKLRERERTRVKGIPKL